MEDSEKKEAAETEKRSSKFFFMIIAFGIIVGALIKLFAFEFLHVSGRSMLPTIQDGETIFVNKLYFGIARPFSDRLLVQWNEPKENDVVIYLYDNKIVVKRCVATAGENLRCCSEHSDDPENQFHENFFLFVGDKKINLTEIQYMNLKDARKVPDGYILAVGDNYEESLDSRNYGFISTKNMLGKVLNK